MAFPTRRIVTGHDAAGRAVVDSDQQLDAQPAGDDGAWFTRLWTTTSWPADNLDATDGARVESGLAAANGSVLRIVDLAPGHHSPLHRTQSLDYGIVLEGEVCLELDDGRIVSLAAGDVVIQRGTMHAWINRGSAPARLAFVLLGAAPLVIGGSTLEPTH
jgi:quercetin dioxygenase-like cupin family protein